jgi:hypothetical protein
VEVAIFHSDDIIENLWYMNALNCSPTLSNYSYLSGVDPDTFTWFTESDREKNNKLPFDSYDAKSHESQNIFEIYNHYGYSHDDKKSKKKHSFIAINLISPKIIVENYGKSDISLEPFADTIGQLVANACQGGGTKDTRPSRIECMRRVIKPQHEAVLSNKTLKEIQRWTRSTAYYTCRKLLKYHGYADEELNRENITEDIEKVCDELGITREECGIYAADRAQLYFRGKTYDIGFDDLEVLAQKGVDMLIIEKEGGAEQLAPLAAKMGIALLNSRGYLVKYAVRLTEIAAKYGCNIAILSDLDIHGLDICSKIPNVYRIGINFKTLEHFGLTFEDVEEEYNMPNISTEGFEKFVTDEEINYLKRKRIEIDSVMIAVNDNQKFWDYLVKELEAKFPYRDYNRAIDLSEYVEPTILTELNDMSRKMGAHLTKAKREEISDGYVDYKGFISDVEEEEQTNSEVFKDIIEKDPQIMKPLLGKIQDLLDEYRNKIDETTKGLQASD